VRVVRSGKVGLRTELQRTTRHPDPRSAFAWALDVTSGTNGTTQAAGWHAASRLTEDDRNFLQSRIVLPHLTSSYGRRANSESRCSHSYRTLCAVVREAGVRISRSQRRGIPNPSRETARRPRAERPKQVCEAVKTAAA
jgi:hypothetical protein